MSGKKARTFDLEAMLGQTIKSAQERSKETLEAREKEHEEANLEKIEKAKREKQKEKANVVETKKKTPVEEEDDFAGPAIPAGFVPTVFKQPPKPKVTKESDSSDSDSSDSDTSDSDDEEDDYGINSASRMTLPISSEISLKHGVKPIAACALDEAGARLLTGGNDYQMKFWDFPGMTQTLEPFRYLEPQEGHQIRSLSYSASGDNILVCTGSSQPLLYDRDGFLICTSVKGDNYLMDASKTPGHQAMVNQGMFHPHNREWYITCSNDGTLRQWDVDTRDKDMFGVIVIKHFDVRKTKDSKGKRATPTSVTYDRTGNLIANGAQDGQLQVWDTRRTVAPKIKIPNAHQANLDITNVTFSYDNNVLASRGEDGFLKLWDMRNTKKVMASRGGMPTLYHNTQSCFSPNDRLVMTGTSRTSKNDGPGKLVFMHRDTLEVAKEVSVGMKSVVTCMWHHRLNQIIYTTNDGLANVLFDEKLSHRGAKLCVAKKKRTAELTEMNVNINVVVPFQPKSFRETNKNQSKESQFLKARKDAKLSHAPEGPINSLVAGQLGRLNAPNGTLHKFIAKEIAMNTADDDPSLIRQKILRHAHAAENSGSLINKAYKQTQPVNVMAEHKTSLDEDSEFNQPLWKRMKYTNDKKDGKVQEDPDKLV